MLTLGTTEAADVITGNQVRQMLLGVAPPQTNLSEIDAVWSGVMRELDPSSSGLVFYAEVCGVCSTQLV